MKEGTRTMNVGLEEGYSSRRVGGGPVVFECLNLHKVTDRGPIHLILGGGGNFGGGPIHLISGGPIRIDRVDEYSKRKWGICNCRTAKRMAYLDFLYLVWLWSCVGGSI